MNFDWGRYKKEIEQFLWLNNAINSPEYLKKSKLTAENLQGMQIHAQVLARSINQQTRLFWSNFFNVKDMAENDNFENPFIAVRKDVLIRLFKNNFENKNVDIYVYKEDVDDESSQTYNDTLALEINYKNVAHVFQFPFTEDGEYCEVFNCMIQIINEINIDQESLNQFYVKAKDVLWESQRVSLMESINERRTTLVPLTKPLTSADIALFNMYDAMQDFAKLADDSYNQFIKEYCNYNDFYTLENIVELSDFINDRKNAKTILKNLDKIYKNLDEYDPEKENLHETKSLAL